MIWVLMGSTTMETGRPLSRTKRVLPFVSLSALVGPRLVQELPLAASPIRGSPDDRGILSAWRAFSKAAASSRKARYWGLQSPPYQLSIASRRAVASSFSRSSSRGLRSRSRSRSRSRRSSPAIRLGAKRPPQASSSVSLRIRFMETPWVPLQAVDRGSARMDDVPSPGVGLESTGRVVLEKIGKLF